jgi:hypothetical protein
MRYGLLGDGGSGLHDIWGSRSATGEAFLSLAIVTFFAVAITVVAIRQFTRAALR